VILCQSAAFDRKRKETNFDHTKNSSKSHLSEHSEFMAFRAILLKGQNLF
jgi:hypothetical protein